MTQLTGYFQMPPRIGKKLSPEQRLLLAIIEQAILDWWGFSRAKARGSRAYNCLHVNTELRKLRLWFEDEDCELWSFRWVCAAAFEDEEFAVKQIRALLKNRPPGK